MYDLWLRLILRPLGRLLGIERWEPHVTSEVACLRCGHEFVVVMPTACPCYDAESGHVFGATCGECGEPACTSL